jgi:hypothetical protein
MLMSGITRRTEGATEAATAVASIGSMDGTVVALEVVTIIVREPARLHPAEIRDMAVIGISTADMIIAIVVIDRGPPSAMADTIRTLTAAEVLAPAEDLRSLN